MGRGRCPTIADNCGVSLRSFPGPPSSPMGDVMQTPQFQLRRLKKQLAIERENRDDLEVELAEHRKLLTEKGQSIVGHGEGGDASLGFCGFVMVLAILMLDAARGFGVLGLMGQTWGLLCSGLALWWSMSSSVLLLGVQVPDKGDNGPFLAAFCRGSDHHDAAANRSLGSAQ